jgi:hypothetical protein
MIPKQILIGDCLWNIELTTDFEKDLYGKCNPSELKIYVKSDLSDFDQISTLVHEVFHAIEYTRNFEIGHRMIEKMENPIASLIFQMTKLECYNLLDGSRRARKSLENISASRARPHSKGTRKTLRKN